MSWSRWSRSWSYVFPHRKLGTTLELSRHAGNPTACKPVPCVASDDGTGAELTPSVVETVPQRSSATLAAIKCSDHMAAIIDASAQLTAIVESSDDAIVAADANGSILTWNRAAERIFGYVASEAIGRPLVLIIPPDRRPEEAAVAARIRHGEAVDRYETLRLCKDGALVPVSLTVAPMRDQQRKVVGMTTIARDISDRHRADVALAVADARRTDLQQRLVALVAASGTLFGSLKRGGRVPAVALSAYARREDRERSLSAGFEAHLSKPVDVEELVATIASVAGASATPHS